MAGRFSVRRPVAPEPIPATEPLAPPPPAGVTWTVFPEQDKPDAPAAEAPASVAFIDAPVATLSGTSISPPPVNAAAAISAAATARQNALQTDKLLDAKVRLHRRLIEEINLSALEKMPEDEIRKHVQQLVS